MYSLQPHREAGKLGNQKSNSYEPSDQVDNSLSLLKATSNSTRRTSVFVSTNNRSHMQRQSSLVIVWWAESSKLRLSSFCLRLCRHIFAHPRRQKLPHHTKCHLNMWFCIFFNKSTFSYWFTYLTFNRFQTIVMLSPYVSWFWFIGFILVVETLLDLSWQNCFFISCKIVTMMSPEDHLYTRTILYYLFHRLSV